MILRTIKYFFLKITSRKRIRPLSVSNIDKKPNIFIRLFESIGGNLYYIFQRAKERFRVWRYRKSKQEQEEGIIFEIIQHSKKLLLNLLLIIILFSLFDYGSYFFLNSFDLKITNFINSLSIGFIELILEISIGAISAILGLIFALYAVGFQITTEKYSSKVSDYINQEIVGNFFFKLLVFTDLFALFTLLKIKFINIYPYFSFPAVIIFVSISFLGILIFKDHYILTLKPKRIFERLWRDLREKIHLVSQRKKRAFKSWSIVQNTRDKSNEFLDLMEFLFDDLLRSKNWNDLIYSPIVLAHILVEYANKKRYIDKERGWWFPRRYEQVKSGDIVSLPIKLDYEIRGTGPLHITTPDFNWFEDRIYKLLEHMTSKIDFIEERDNLILNIIKAYQIILAGDYVKDRFGRYQKEIHGAYENQETAVFEKFFTGFRELFSKIDFSNDSIMIAYMNTYFAIGLVIVEGFEYEHYRKVIKNLINDKFTLALTREKLENIKLPTIFYNKLLDYYDRLEIEQYCEGDIKTPKDWLEHEVISGSQVEEKELFDNYFKLLIEHQNRILDELHKNKQYKNLALFLKMRLEWFSRLLYIKKLELAEEQARVITNKITYILDIPKNILIEIEFLEAIEKLIFPAILESKSSLFNNLAQSLRLLLSVLNYGESDVDCLIERNRLVLILGGFIYFVSEFEQDQKFLIDYVKTLERAYQPGFFAKLVEMMADPRKLGGLRLTLKLIQLETARYHHWFVQVLQKVDALPKTYGKVRSYVGLQEVADHPSKFIREISYGPSFYEEECINAFVEWVKKQEEIKKLVNLLNNLLNKTKNDK